MQLAVVSVSVNYVRSEKPSEKIIEKRLGEFGEELMEWKKWIKIFENFVGQGGGALLTAKHYTNSSFQPYGKRVDLDRDPYSSTSCGSGSYHASSSPSKQGFEEKEWIFPNNNVEQ